MKSLRMISRYALGALAVLTMASCSDAMDELTSFITGRNLSPINLEARVINSVNVRMNWTLVKEATSYDIEVYNDSMQFVGSPVKTATVTADDLPYTITGLEGEEPYTIRVKAVTEGDASRDSKWSSVFVETGREQIFYAVADEDLTYTSVTLRWPEGESADVITLKPGNIEHQLTAAEIAAGAATIDGLTDDTDYKATMTRGEKTRGTIEFHTPLNLNGATAVEPGDDLQAIIDAAEPDAVLALMPGEFGIPAGEDASYQYGAITLTKSITIRSAKSRERATIHGRFVINGGASLDLMQVALDGTGTSGDQAFNYKEDGTYDHLNVQDCSIANFTKGFYYLNVTATVKNITVNNTIIHDIECDGGDMFDCRKGYVAELNLTNSTVYNCAAKRDVFRMDDASADFPGVSGPKYTVNACTFFNVGDGAANYRFFYLRFAGNTITFTNNIVSGFNNKRGFANQSSTDQSPTLARNYYYNTKNLLEADPDNTEKVSWYDTAGTALTAQPFADPANANFTITDEDMIFYGIGDPRWR